MRMPRSPFRRLCFRKRNWTRRQRAGNVHLVSGAQTPHLPGSTDGPKMGDGLQFLELIFFALVAAFLVMRLRNVLGRRDGHRPTERHDPFRPEPTGDEKIVRLPEREDRRRSPFDEESEAEPTPAPASALAEGLAQIRTSDRSFDPEAFMGGARIAFEMIVDAFAKGDDAALKPLLSPEVYNNFVRSIRERLAAGETLETELIAVRSMELTEAYMAGRTAHLTVRIVSDQVRCLRDETGQVIDGDPERVQEVVDVWTFARDTRSPDPNWQLVATGTPE